MSQHDECTRCGASDFEDGALQSAGTVSFRPKATKFLKLSPGNISVSSRICMQCGLIELTTDVAKVASLVRRPVSSDIQPRV